LEACPHLTVRSLAEELRAPGFEVSHNAVWHQLRRAGCSFKKTQFAAEHDRPKIARRREQWKKYQERLDPTRLVFVDETWASMTPIRGCSRRGDKLLAKAQLPSASGGR
jgi:hypothetical protein